MSMHTTHWLILQIQNTKYKIQNTGQTLMCPKLPDEHREPWDKNFAASTSHPLFQLN